MGPKTCNIMNHAKLRHRSSISLKDWSSLDYYIRQGVVLDKILNCAIEARKDGVRTIFPDHSFVDNIERVRYDDLS